MPTTFYLRNLLAANPPSAAEKSTALPVDTQGANNAAGTDETRSLDTAKGVAQTSLAKNSDAVTAARDNYLCRFTSAGLAAQAIAAATWTIALALNEGNAAANSFLNLSVYVWRPSTQAVVGFIYDSHTNIGVEWGNTEDGQVITFSGSAVTTALNDVLVLEVWRHAAQAMTVAYAQTVYFEGATDVVDTTTTDAASYLQNPNTITFGTQTFNQTLTATAVGSTATRQLQANKIVTASIVTSVATLAKQMAQTLTATIVSSIATMTRGLTLGRTLTATAVAAAATMTRGLSFGRTLTATVVAATATMTRGLTFGRTLSAVSTVVARLLRQRSFGLPFLYTAANWGTVSFFLEVWMRAATGTARARLYNETDGVAVTGSDLTTTSGSYVRLRSGALTLTDGKLYNVQYGSEDADSGAFRGGKLVVV